MSFIQQFFTSRDNNANAETFVGQEGRLWWDPTTNQIYSSDGVTPGGIPLAGGGGGNGTPGGSNGQVQFNQAGAFGGSANLSFNATTGALTAVSFVGNGAALTSITGSNVSGTVADASHATVADSANSVAGGNVSGNVSNAVHAYFSDVANSVAGANVSGNVSQAVHAYFADVANSVAGANVSGVVANATYAVSAGSATTAGTVTTAAQPNITSTGTLISITSTGNISTTGNVTGGYILGNGSQLTGIVSSYGNANVATYLASGTDNSNIVTTANVSGAYILGNGSQLTGIVSSYGNANVAANLAAFGSNPISTTGNVTAGYFIGNGSALTSITGANVSGTVANATYAATAGSTTQLVNGSYSLVLNNDGTMAVPGNLINTGANPVGFWSTNTVTSYWRSPTGGGAGLPFQSTTAMANTGITLTFLSGVANTLTSKIWTFGFNGNLTFPDATVQTTAFTGTATSATTAGTVTTNAQPNITSVGTLTSVTVTGNTTGGNLLTGGLISATGNITSSANITGGNVLTGGLVSATGTITSSANITGGNLLTGGLISATGNITSAANIAGGNLIGTHVGNLTGTTASLSGNVTGGNLTSVNQVITGNGSLSQPGFRFAGDVDTGMFLLSDGNLAITTNAGTRAIFFDSGLNVPGLVSAGGNVISGNLLTGGLVSATGNIIGGNILGGANVNATTHTGTSVSVTANVTGGNITTAGTVSATGATNSTAFAVGNSAVSNVALGYFPTAGTAAEMAIRDYSTVPSTMYFDNSIGNAGQGGQFQFRGGSSYTQWARIDQYGINLPTRPAFRVYGAGTTTINATNTLTGNNWAVDFNQNNNLNSTTGVFTAPVAGLYQVNLIARNGGSASTSAILVRKTSGGVDTTQVYVEWAPNSTMFHAGGSTVTKMAANDTLRLIVVSGTVTFDANDTWSVSYIG